MTKRISRPSASVAADNDNVIVKVSRLRGVVLKHGGDQGGEGLDQRRAAILGQKIAARTLWGCQGPLGPLEGNPERIRKSHGKISVQNLDSR
jgi:hypothetical protein